MDELRDMAGLKPQIAAIHRARHARRRTEVEAALQRTRRMLKA